MTTKELEAYLKALEEFIKEQKEFLAKHEIKEKK